MKDQSNYKYEIKEKIGVLSTSPKGWTYELNIVDWGKGSKYDLRQWAPERVHFSQGARFTEEEIKALYALLKQKLEEA